ncbi:MAG: asparagine synthase (glutamine-hydrolyzing) [Deltaproteobacteria bacterium]|nr:asparagine synthase (glutamine-hydrolyzing) [Deltaproteobacteria bacterium]
MCGIAGILTLDGRPVDRDQVQRMCDSIVHRGPDDEGLYFGAGVGLGMRRLSIIDLKTGHQPISNEDGSIWVVFNGEIYNFKELRADLKRRGHLFATGTDTETIVHLYEEYGKDCVQRMRGMFTFAVWDSRQRTLLLARDRLGIKPLYFAQAGKKLVFASELKAILQLPDVERRLDWGSVNYLFSFLSTPASKSILEGVHKLEPGHLLIASPGQSWRIESYWDVQFEPDYRHSEEYFVERLRELIEESVRLRLVSEVPLGAFLSGGIDSSSIVRTMAGLSSAPVKTFSIGFNEGGYNELEYARLVAKRLGTEHHELVLEPDVLGIIDDLPWYLDEPFGDPSAIPTYMVSKLASEHVTVVLSGDGGDELFAGYDRYAVEERERAYRIPSLVRNGLRLMAEMMPEGMKGRNFLRHFSYTGAERYMDSLTLFSHEEKQKLFQPEAFRLLREQDSLPSEIESLSKMNGNWLSGLQYLDLKSYLPLDILTKVDRMSMAHSIEVRVPLLDHKLVEFAATIPPELKLRRGITKDIFKRAMRGLLPDEIIDRPKKGFAIPLGSWFRGKLDRFVRELLLSETTRRRGILSPPYIEKILQLHERGRNLDFQIWTLISFELWCRRFLDQSPICTVRGAPQDSPPVVESRAQDCPA